MNNLYQLFVVTGTIVNKSPLIIGIGKGSDTADIELIKDKKGDVFIPGTSLAGAIKHHLTQTYNTKIAEFKEAFTYFWGASESQEQISSCVVIDNCAPLQPNRDKITIRDGVKINNSIGIAEEKHKFDYEVLEPECEFNFNMELFVPSEFEKTFLAIFNTIIQDLQSMKISLGAMTTKGFGKILLKDTKIFHFTFPTDGEKWFKYLANEITEQDVNYQIEKQTMLPVKNQRMFKMTAKFKLKNSLIVGAYTTNSDDPDKVNLVCNDKPIIPGTSWKGALRARAEKILNTLNSPHQNELSELFGDAKKENGVEVKRKSRFLVEDSFVDGAEEKIQTRIKIDRFTGGTIDGALFESKPLWTNNEEVELRIQIVQVKDWEIGLMLLLLKDLWTSDLPIGGEKNIGRGVLKGINAMISINDEEYTLKQKEDGKIELIPNQVDKLDNYVKKLLEKGDE